MSYQHLQHIGDNRGISKDSRSFGAVKKENIGGKVIKLFG